MCGIFAYSGSKKNAGDLILQGLASLEYRGYDSWGVAAIDNKGKVLIEKHVGKIGAAKLPPITSSIGIGHTRWATHGGVLDKNAHPHPDCTKKIIVVHNGIVENFESLKKDLIKKGHTFLSDTDTEVISHHIEEKLKSKPHGDNRKETILQVFRDLKGLNAIIVFFPEHEEFYAIKNGSPIVFGHTSEESIIASDAVALLPYTQKAYFLEDNELLVINNNSCELFDLEGNKKSFHFIDLKITQEDASLGNYPHYMLKEIYEQPKVLQNILDTQQLTLQELAAIIKNAYGTYFIGCGTASYAGLAGTYLFSKIAKRHVNTSIASEFSYLVDFLKDTSLIVALSQSGETIDIISSIKEAKKKGAKILAVTNVIGSTLYRIADYKFLLSAGPEKAVCSTKAYTAKIATLYLLSLCLSGKLREQKVNLQNAIEETKKILKKTAALKKLAESIKSSRHIFILGRGVSYAAALESSLKIKEISYIHAEGFAGGELKHGVIALIEKDTPVIVFNPEDETYEDTLSSAHEVKARGAWVIGISNKHNAVYDEFIHVENCEEATIIPNVVVAQLIGYYLSVLRDNDPDKPRNLAKSVTVK